MGDRLKAYIQRAIGRQQRPAVMRKAMHGVAGQSSVGVASVQPPAKALRDDEAYSEPMSREEEMLLDDALYRTRGKRGRQAAEQYAAKYRSAK